MIRKIILNLGLKLTSWGTPPQSIPNLIGDRDIEWSWVASQMPNGPGFALDFGNGGSNIGLIAAQRDFQVIAVDLALVQWFYKHPNLRFVKGDILKLSFPEEHFDLIINCSTVEHVGLSGRYGVTENDEDGDLKAMKCLKHIMNQKGMMILTIPVGKDTVIAPLHRIYGNKRLPKLLDGYKIEKEIFWVKDIENRWAIVDKEMALNFEASSNSENPIENIYAIGCFVLRK